MTDLPPRCAGVLLRGCGSATPARSISNDELGDRVETSDTWIRSRTGIAARRVVGREESLTALSAKAAEAALEMAGWSADSLDLILLATSTPDDLFGSAPRLQARIGAVRAAAFDLTAACSGFLCGDHRGSIPALRCDAADPGRGSGSAQPLGRLG